MIILYWYYNDSLLVGLIVLQDISLFELCNIDQVICLCIKVCFSFSFVLLGRVNPLPSTGNKRGKIVPLYRW